ncbi:MAG: hypothetical protein HFJ29_04725 [Clostridia bacterium]|nr:hypothetical protein [Clostridia bacterium]
MIDLESSICKWQASQEIEEKIAEGQGAEKVLKSIAEQMEIRGRNAYDTIKVNLFHSQAYSVSYDGGMQHRFRFAGDYEDVGLRVMNELRKYESKLQVEIEKKGNEIIITIKLRKKA